jgi:hypothetical protein
MREDLSIMVPTVEDLFPNKIAMHTDKRSSSFLYCIRQSCRIMTLSIDCRKSGAVITTPSGLTIETKNPMIAPCAL